MANIPYTAQPRTAPQRPTATPAAVSDYCSTHTTTEAATYFGVSDRYIRKMKVRAAHTIDTQTPASVPQRTAELPSMPTSPIPLPMSVTPTYATVAVSAVADGDCMWKCPHCGDLQHPLPGTTGEQWRESGCYLCSTRRAAPIVMSMDAEPIGGTEQVIADAPAEPESEPELEEMRPCLEVPAEPEPTIATPRFGTIPAEQTPFVIRERVVYRVPVDRRDSPVLVWARDNMPLTQLLIALAITMVLIGVANLG